ncbi:hypothetical protein FQZ97_1022040 [compost metagenome]
MPGAVGHRAGLAPTGHPRIDQARIAFERDVRAKTQALHRAGAKPFNHHIGTFDQFQRSGDTVRALQVEGDRTPIAPGNIGTLAFQLRPQVTGLLRAVDTHHVGAHIGQQHGAKRRRPDCLKLHHPNATQYAHCQRSTVLTERHSTPILVPSSRPIR